MLRALRIAGSLAAALVLGLAAAPAGELEQRFADWRELRDQIDITEALGRDAAPSGRTLRDLRAAAGRLQAELAPPLAHPVAGVEEPARKAMGRALAAQAEDAPTSSTPSAPDCHYDPGALARGGLAKLQSRIYTCYGKAAGDIHFGGETLDRLTVLSRLTRIDDPAERRRLFLALDPVWRTMNGDDGPASPYRRMLALSAAEWRAKGSPVERNASALGVAPADAERWLVRILEAWRDATAGESIEPWDLHYRAGAASRALAEHIPQEQLAPLNAQFYRSLGADPGVLPIRYDLEPRVGKTPVAFTTFGRRPRLQPGAANGAVAPGEAWVFATYRAGGLDNLVELLHETGHAIHILAIRTRPAFADWPDSDTYTEGLGDLVALEAYEPEWQQRWLGTSASLKDNLRAKYASIVLDIAWALFEVRMHRDPAADPNAVWAELTHRYLHVVEHRELSWWAMRGQLVDSPGYMSNYALGAIAVADLRARCRELRGPFYRPDPGMYAFLSEKLYQFGLERSSRAVVEPFLGRPISPDPLIQDLARMQAAGGAPR